MFPWAVNQAREINQAVAGIVPGSTGPQREDANGPARIRELGESSFAELSLRSSRAPLRPLLSTNFYPGYDWKSWKDRGVGYFRMSIFDVSFGMTKLFS